MGSLGFDGEDDSNIYKSRKLLHDWDAKVPRKLRSAMKKWGRESITPFLPISSERHRAFNGAETRQKKPKLNKKQRRVTKDEEEVAETLNSLADLFSNATNTKSKSSPVVEEGNGILKLQKESRKTNSHGQQPVLPFSKESPTLSFCGVRSNLSPKVDEFRGLSLSSTGALSFGTQRLSTTFENTNCATQPSADKYPRVVPEPKSSWKRCLAHVYIARLIKALQKPDRRDGLLEQPTPFTTTGAVERVLHLRSTENQIRGIDGTNSIVCFNELRHYENNSRDVQNGILMGKRLFQDYPEASLTSTLEHGSNFLSLAAGGSSDASGANNRDVDNQGTFKHFHLSYSQTQSDSSMLFSPPGNGYLSTFNDNTSAGAAQQVQFPPYLSTTFNTGVSAPVRQHLEPRQQKWAGQYNMGRIANPYSPKWQNGGRDATSLINYAQSILPHFNSNYRHLSTPQQQTTPIDSSMPFSYANRGFESNGGAFYYDNIQQMQLLCNQRI